MMSVYKADKYLKIRKNVKWKNTTGNNKCWFENPYFRTAMSDKPWLNKHLWQGQQRLDIIVKVDFMAEQLY